MDLFHNLALGFGVVFQFVDLKIAFLNVTIPFPMNIFLCFVGAMVGTLIGVLPGIGPLATIAMLLAVFTTIGTTLLVFGIWALLSGAIQLTVAVRRRRAVGAQWPMMISGGLSVLAGASFAAMSASDTSGLSALAGYSAFGAFWFLVSALVLSRHSGATR